MKLKVIFIAILLFQIFNFTSTALQGDFSVLKSSYLGQKPPGLKPEIFAPGIISKKGSDEWGCALNENWTEIFFSRAENDKASIIYTERLSGSWSVPTVAAFSGKYNDSHPVFSPFDSKIFFGSKRPCPGAKEELNIWFTEKVNDSWNIPKSLGHPFTNQTVHAASVAPNGNIYAAGLVVFKKNDFGYKNPERLVPNISGSHPAVSPDGSYIVFSKRHKDGFGGTDLYVVFKKKDNYWTTPVNLGKDVNTKHVESSPTISLDGKFLFFSRKGDIWWVSSHVIDNIKRP